MPSSNANSGGGSTAGCVGYSAGTVQLENDRNCEMKPSVPTVNLLGVSLAKLTRGAVVNHIFDALARGAGGWVVTPNVDHLRRHLSEQDGECLFASADLTVADGVPLLWAARLQGTPLPDRVAGSDLVWLLAERASRDGRSVYLMGGERGVAEVAARRFTERWPNLRIAGISRPLVSAQPIATERIRYRVVQPG